MKLQLVVVYVCVFLEREVLISKGVLIPVLQRGHLRRVLMSTHNNLLKGTHFVREGKRIIIVQDPSAACRV